MPQFRVDYGDAVIPDGFFLKREAPPQPAQRYADGDGSFFRHLSTFPGRSTIKEAVLDLLARAERHVFFCNFLLQDEGVLRALLVSAQRLHGHVYILTTLKADDFAQSGGTGDDAEGDFESHLRCVKQLTQQGLLVKARSDCHAKFMTVDDAKAVVTSANAVPTCYGNVPKPQGGTREANPENGVLFEVPGEVRRLANFFRALWRDACNYYVAPDASVFEVQQTQSGTPPVRPTEPSRPAEEGEVLWTAPGDVRLLRRFLSMVQRARQRLDLSTWVVKGMDTHELGDALRKAAARGVRTRLLVRGMNWRDDHRRQCYLLARALGDGAVILGDYWNHSKAVVADAAEALVLTANLDAQHGLGHGIEVGFHSGQPPFVAAVHAFLDRLASDAAFAFVPDPTQATMAERYGRQRGQRLGGVIRIRLQAKGPNVARLARRWCDAAVRELVRVAMRKGKGREEVLLLTDRMALYARPGDAGNLTAHHVNESPPAEDLKLFDSYLGRATLICETAG
jgi:phosphatidylserine/phosphatidylglycerophosphate/cardiolipin synthase-like enzyme